jgi:hypothetical protein
MSEDQENLPEVAFKLDGSMGVGENALLTLIVKDDVEGDIETAYQFPYALINFGSLNTALAYKFIMGYKVLRQDKVSQ